MSGPAWMAFYPADYLGATRHLTAAQHGAYLLLIMSYWNDGGLPSDDVILARLAAMTDKEWRASKNVIAAFFQPNWRHTRIDRELAKAAQKSARRADAGALGGAAKAAKTPSKPLAIATNLLEQNPSKPLANDLALSRDISHSTSKKEIPPNHQQPLPPSPSAGMSHAALLDALCEAAGITADQRFPGLQVTGPITDMIEAGWSLERHILPVLRAKRELGQRGQSWHYYAKIIKNDADAPPKVHPPPANGSLDHLETKDQFLARFGEKHGLTPDGKPISN